MKLINKRYLKQANEWNTFCKSYDGKNDVALAAFVHMLDNYAHAYHLRNSKNVAIVRDVVKAIELESKGDQSADTVTTAMTKLIDALQINAVKLSENSSLRAIIQVVSEKEHMKDSNKRIEMVAGKPEPVILFAKNFRKATGVIYSAFVLATCLKSCSCILFILIEKYTFNIIYLICIRYIIVYCNAYNFLVSYESACLYILVYTS